MGLFDFFKKKTNTVKDDDHQPGPAINQEELVVATLQTRLTELGYTVKRHEQWLGVVINNELEIATAIIDHPDSHPSIINLLTLTTHPACFPEGIRETMIGIGTSLQDKINSVISNYLSTTFQPIMDSFTESHQPDLDFFSWVNGKEILWHPKLGNLAPQGTWTAEPEGEPFFNLLRKQIAYKLTSAKFNWLKCYIAKRADGTIIGDCILNNDPWPEGLAIITAYAQDWKLGGEFQGLKQFMVFRRCDAYDQQI